MALTKNATVITCEKIASFGFRLINYSTQTTLLLFYWKCNFILSSYRNYQRILVTFLCEINILPTNLSHLVSVKNYIRKLNIVAQVHNWGVEWYRKFVCSNQV